MILFEDLSPSEALRVSRQRSDGFRRVMALVLVGWAVASVLASSVVLGLVALLGRGVAPYGRDSLEIHRDAVEAGQRVLIVDDLIATGGTAAATAHMVSLLGGEIAELAFLVELEFLNGRQRLDGFDVYSILKY